MIKKLLKHPVIILLGVAVGVLIGVFNARISSFLGIRSFADTIAFPGQLYLFFLQMTVIPIIITAISSSLGKLMRSKSSAGLIKKIVAVFLICMLICAVTGIAIGMFGKPGAGLDEKTRTMLSGLLASEQASGILEMTLSSSDDSSITLQRPGMASFFTNMVPANIFQALSLGSVMAILFFSIIFGIAIGFLPESSAELLINLCTAIFQAFQKLISWSLYLLPFGLICLLAGQIASVGVQIFIAMSKFITLYTAGTIAIFLVCTIIIWFRSGIRNPFKVLSILFEPMLLAFATRNSMACLPSAITCLDSKMKFNSTSVNLTLPLGMTLGRFGNIFYFALAVFFIGQIYNTPFEPFHFLIILIGVIFAGTATAGASGIVTLSMLSIVLEPLSLPMEAVLIIFMAIDPIIDPFRSFLIVYVNMAATSLVANKGDNSEPVNTAIEHKKLLKAKQTGKAITVFIQEFTDIHPLLWRKNGTLEGLELTLLNEIGSRINKKVILLDRVNVNPAEEVNLKRDANIIAGVVTKIGKPPLGFFYSEAWGSLDDGNFKKPVCFLLSENHPESAEINTAIKELKAENYIQHLLNG